MERRQAVLVAAAALVLVPTALAVNGLLAGPCALGHVDADRTAAERARSNPEYDARGTVTLKMARVVAVKDLHAAPGEGSWLSDAEVTFQFPDGCRLTGIIPAQRDGPIRKWNGVPFVGQEFQATGKLVGSGASAVMDPIVKWVEASHQGRAVTVEDLTLGRIPDGSYVWTERVRVTQQLYEGDGDILQLIEAPSGGPALLIEVTPPFSSDLPPVDLGAYVRMYGMVLWDAELGWYELHPVRDWKSS